MSVSCIDSNLHCPTCPSEQGQSFLVPHLTKTLVCSKHSTYVEYTDKFNCIKCKSVGTNSTPIDSSCTQCTKERLLQESREQRKKGFKNLMFDFSLLRGLRPKNNLFDENDMNDYMTYYINIETGIGYGYDFGFDVWTQLTHPEIITLDNNERSTTRPQIVPFDMCMESYPCQHSLVINGNRKTMTGGKAMNLLKEYGYQPHYSLHSDD